MKNRLFGHRLGRFFPANPPDVRVLPDQLRQEVLSGRTAKHRIEVIANWAATERLQFVSIDSAVKLFPPGHDMSRADLASDVFNQLQRLPTVWIIAHDRKQQPGMTTIGGNAEIVGSGRFAQDPDVIHEMARPDRRAPVAWFSWGKMREGEKSESIQLYFDRVNYRLYPLHPYLHLLSERPALESDLIAEAERRYGWKERRAGEYLATLRRVVDANVNPCVKESKRGHNKAFEISARPISCLVPET